MIENEKFFWMSFTDPKKPKDEQFLGVIITMAPDVEQAMLKTHLLGINPGGEIRAFECPFEGSPDNVKPEDFDKLLSLQYLKESGYER